MAPVLRAYAVRCTSELCIAHTALAVARRGCGASSMMPHGSRRARLAMVRPIFITCTCCRAERDAERGRRRKTMSDARPARDDRDANAAVHRRPVADGVGRVPRVQRRHARMEHGGHGVLCHHAPAAAGGVCLAVVADL